MKTNETTREVKMQAADALSSVLRQMSAIKSWRIKFRSAGSRRADILADVDVYGRNHKLVCRVADGRSGDVPKVIEKLRSRVTSVPQNTTPVLIAPYLSPQNRALCEQSRVGFIDLEGNARLEIDETFIGKRSCRSEVPSDAPARLSA